MVSDGDGDCSRLPGGYRHVLYSLDRGGPGIYDAVQSNENVATVDQNGVVTRVGPGTTTITATATDGTNVFGTCRVTVEEAPSALDLTPSPK